MKRRQLDELDPNQIVRLRDGPKYFGYKLTQQDEKIKRGELPPPVPLSETGRAKGWFGSQILEHQAKLRDRAARKRES